MKGGRMKDYVVRWTIDVQAENEEDAALEAALAELYETEKPDTATLRESPA